MSDRLRALIDEHDVIQVATELFVATDRRDWDAVRACFAPEVQFDMTSLSGGEPARMSPDQIAAGWQEGLAPVDAVHHQAGNFQAAVSGDRATVSCYGIAYHYRAKATRGKTRIFVGTYDFTLLRSGAQWSIDGFRFDCKFIEGNVTLE